ncbi:hypothetical protein [Thiocystis violacea]|uniref:hypothetical protein n=1 Tax=Thiocystis violacea TaxID=13725 RepID=UPI00190598DD|nr:hypothetical protein [Thiocystis violacea]MBK1723728.1 hypothetical protein [Thiocystis violacea]
MNVLIKTLVWLCGIAIAAGIGLAALVILDSRPLLETDMHITAAERAWVQRWIAVNRPSANRSEGLNSLSLNEREANLLLNALVDKIGQGRGHVHLGQGGARILVSLRLPFDQVQSYLNLDLSVVEGDPLPRIASARIAGLPIPGVLAQTLVEQALGAVERAQILDQVQIQRDRILVSYAWRPYMLEHLGSGLVAAADLPHVLRYQARLETLTADKPRRKPIELADLLAALLAAADADQATDPVTSNRAVILALAAYVNGRVMHDPAEADTGNAKRPRVVLLRGRRDLGQHFMTSAALAVQGNDTLSSLIGWYKEVSDSDGGSGFSFADMTANRAGIRFAQLATQSPASARRLQQVAARGLTADDFMPPIDGLPEGMSRDSFTSRFGDPKTQAYQRMLTAIDQRIDARPLFNL